MVFMGVLDTRNKRNDTFFFDGQMVFGDFFFIGNWLDLVILST